MITKAFDLLRTGFEFEFDQHIEIEPDQFGLQIAAVGVGGAVTDAYIVPAASPNGVGDVLGDDQQQRRVAQSVVSRRLDGVHR